MFIDARFMKDALISAALAGGRLIREHFQTEGVEVSAKSSPGDLVTNIDLLAQESIITLLQRTLPGIPIVSEEKENANPPEEAIYVDPIDGTLNYVHGLGIFSVSIGYWRRGVPVAGVVYNPIEDGLYHAVKGEGAFRNNRPLRVSGVNRLDRSLLATGWPYTKSEIPRAIEMVSDVLPLVQEIRCLGSASMALCNVAAGNLDAYWEWGLEPWDISGGIAIVKEGGGEVTDLSGGELDIAAGRLVASNGMLHRQIVDLLKTFKEGL